MMNPIKVFHQRFRLCLRYGYTPIEKFQRLLTYLEVFPPMCSRRATWENLNPLCEKESVKKKPASDWIQPSLRSRGAAKVIPIDSSVAIGVQGRK